jgi:hypothetical protein
LIEDVDPEEAPPSRSRAQADDGRGASLRGLCGAIAARRRLEIYDYTGRLMRALGLPRVVFATHWDEQSFPFGAPQDDRLREAEVFVREVKKVSPRTRVVLPGHFERHTLPQKRSSVSGG